jgi:hypothetical protein
MAPSTALICAIVLLLIATARATVIAAGQKTIESEPTSVRLAFGF